MGEWVTLETVGGLLWKAREAAPSAESAVWFVLDGDGTPRGPLTSAQLREMLAHDVIMVESAVWSATLGEWKRICDTLPLRAIWDASQPPVNRARD